MFYMFSNGREMSSVTASFRLEIRSVFFLVMCTFPPGRHGQTFRPYSNTSNLSPILEEWAGVVVNITCFVNGRRRLLLSVEWSHLVDLVGVHILEASPNLWKTCSRFHRKLARSSQSKRRVTLITVETENLATGGRPQHYCLNFSENKERGRYGRNKLQALRRRTTGKILPVRSFSFAFT